jgi:hypothetical protein
MQEVRTNSGSAHKYQNTKHAFGFFVFSSRRRFGKNVISFLEENIRDKKTEVTDTLKIIAQ